MGTVDPGPKACAKSSSEQPLDFAIEHPLPLSPFAPRSGLVTPRQTFALRRRAGVSWRRGKAKFQIGRFPRRGGGPRSEFTWKVAPPFRKLKSGSNRLRYEMLIDYVTKPWYRIPILAHEGRLRRRSCRRSGGSGVLRSGTPPARHDDLAARSSLYGSGGNAGDGSAAPGRNRHGGAPRGERPASWDAPRLSSAEVAPRTRDNKTIAPVGAPPPWHLRQ